YGGPIYSTFELTKAIKKQGIDIKVITTNANGKERLDIKTGVFNNLNNNLPVKYYKSIDSRGTSLSMLWNLKDEIKQADIVYLISIFSAPTPFVVGLCKKLDKPLIISPRGQLGRWCLNQGNPFKKLWLSLFIKPFIGSLNWHLTSQDEERSVQAVYPSAKTFVIANGIDSSILEIKEQRKNKLFYTKYSENVNENSKIIIAMGRLQKVKGFDILIEAVKKVQEQVQDVFLFIAGEDFGEKQNLLNFITSNHLSEKVFLISHIAGEEKINFLKNADVFALPSHHENFGIVYAEALAAGTPVIASKNAPWQDVEKFKCGKWVENTQEKFAEAIIEILNSDTEQMGKNGTQFIKNKYNWNNLAQEFMSKVTSILSL
ncbi:glycosyltransferase, partial [Ignavibacterium sp.]|uniref:glycosyltransferase n=1 Tax=Ignavibacterium sp. TaxID=2651167 RepID=UPI00307E8B3E